MSGGKNKKKKKKVLGCIINITGNTEKKFVRGERTTHQYVSVKLCQDKKILEITSCL